jgi:signal peptidase II
VNLLTRLYLKLASIAGVTIAIDQATKSYALANFNPPKDLIDGVLTLRVAYNSGGAFGILQGLPEVFLVATVITAIVIVLWIRKLEQPGWIAPLGLVLGGGLGNVADRVFRDTGGRVVDFVDLQVWPVFNVADACIVVGVGWIFVAGMRDQGEEGVADGDGDGDGDGKDHAQARS